MTSDDEVWSILQPYLATQHGLSADAIGHLKADWNQRGPTLDLGRNLLTRVIARAIEAVRKGYDKASIESVLGLPAAGSPQTELAPAEWPSIETLLPALPRPMALTSSVVPRKPAIEQQLGRDVLPESPGEGPPMALAAGEKTSAGPDASADVRALIPCTEWSRGLAEPPLVGWPGLPAAPRIAPPSARTQIVLVPRPPPSPPRLFRRLRMLQLAAAGSALLLLMFFAFKLIGHQN